MKELTIEEAKAFVLSVWPSAHVQRGFEPHRQEEGIRYQFRSSERSVRSELWASNERAAWMAGWVHANLEMRRREKKKK